MKCIHCQDNPEGEMEILVGYDDPYPGKGKLLIAFNIYYCKYCGSLCRRDVWQRAGETWIFTDGTIHKIPQMKETKEDGTD